MNIYKFSLLIIKIVISNKKQSHSAETRGNEKTGNIPNKLSDMEVSQNQSFVAITVFVGIPSSCRDWQLLARNFTWWSANFLLLTLVDGNWANVESCLNYSSSGQFQLLKNFLSLTIVLAAICKYQSSFKFCPAWSTKWSDFLQDIQQVFLRT